MNGSGVSETPRIPYWGVLYHGVQIEDTWHHLKYPCAEAGVGQVCAQSVKNPPHKLPWVYISYTSHWLVILYLLKVWKTADFWHPKQVCWINPSDERRWWEAWQNFWPFPSDSSDIFDGVLDHASWQDWIWSICWSIPSFPLSLDIKYIFRL